MDKKKHDEKCNIQELKKLKKIVEEQKLLLDNIPAQIWCLTDPITYKSINKAHADFLGVKKEEVIKKNPYSKIYTPKEAQRCISVNKQVFDKKISISTEEYVKNSKGELRVLHITKTPILNDNGDVEYIVCCAQDITERKKAEEEIRYMSFHDSLTGLYNRVYVYKELERIDKSCEQLPLSIIIGDTNGLKLTNDVFGHSEGDKLLVNIANVLMETCRKQDIVSRIGGDEFLIVLPKTTEQETERIIENINKNCLKFRNKIMRPSISFGYAVKTSNEQKIDQVLKLAEERMYRTKLTESEKVKASIISSIREALNINTTENNEYYNMVQELCLKVGQKVGLNQNTMNDLKLLVQMHDIGKVAISQEILSRCGDDIEGECSLVGKHPEIGYRIAINSPELIAISEAILSHHERWDGTGYPRGIKEREIPYIARIFAIVNSYVKMVKGNSHIKKVSINDAIKAIKEGAGKQYDPNLVEKFLDVIKSEKTT